MDLIKLRGITSTALIVVFALVVFTGIGMYFAPSGRVAYEAGWTFFGIQKFQLENLLQNVCWRSQDAFQVSSFLFLFPVDMYISPKGLLLAPDAYFKPVSFKQLVNFSIVFY